MVDDLLPVREPAVLVKDQALLLIRPCELEQGAHQQQWRREAPPESKEPALVSEKGRAGISAIKLPCNLDIVPFAFKLCLDVKGLRNVQDGLITDRLPAKHVTDRSLVVSGDVRQMDACPFLGD